MITIEEAIESLRRDREMDTEGKGRRLDLAKQLGIEALERLKEARAAPNAVVASIRTLKPLPSEKELE